MPLNPFLTLALVSVSVLEHLLAPAFALVIAVEVTSEHTGFILLQAMFFDKVKTFFFDHEHEFLLVGVSPIRSLFAILTQRGFVLVGAAQVDFTLAVSIHAIDCGRSILLYALHALWFTAHTLTEGRPHVLSTNYFLATVTISDTASTLGSHVLWFSKVINKIIR